MIRISQLKLPAEHTRQELMSKISKRLRLPPEQIGDFRIRRQSIDARKKSEICYVYTVDVSVSNQEKFLKNYKGRQIEPAPEAVYRFHACGKQKLQHRPVIVGSGPAGLFCAYMLAEAGYRPLLLERGADITERMQDVEQFWNTGVLKPDSNVQFGEGGAGTFSDGKLNTLVKDKEHRNQKVLELFVEHGAPEEILYVNKPHIGTDILMQVVSNIRNHILTLGGEVSFHSKLTDIRSCESRLTGIEINGNRTMDTDILVLAIGHSARDTFSMLYEKQIPMEAKAFAVGVRIEHPQNFIDVSQYGSASTLPPAAYKLAATLPNGRGVYSFCMCPGGYVVNASSEEGRLAINGMSYHDRAGQNANSAIVVTVTPEDFQSTHPLAGVHYQRTLEERAYQAGMGKIPVQTFADYCSHRTSSSLGTILPQMKKAYQLSNVRAIFPEELSDSIEQGIKCFDQSIPGFAGEDVLLSAVESRTSSPVRILRDHALESTVKGLYPCGEGAGYAGGITSAAMDGIRTAEAIAATYAADL